MYGACFSLKKELDRQNSTHSVITDNSEWGSDITGLSPKFEPSAANTFNNLYPNFIPQEYLHPSIVSVENKTTFSDPGDINPANNYAQAVAFDALGSGIWVGNVAYRRVSGTLGSMISTTGVPPIWITPFVRGNGCVSNQEHNPCITINSSGQQFIAWERVTDNVCQNNTISSVAVANSLIGKLGKPESYQKYFYFVFRICYRRSISLAEKSKHYWRTKIET